METSHTYKEKTRRMEVCKFLKMFIKWSTMIPFRWHVQCKYMCFHCDELFKESSMLKEHLKNHSDVNLNKLFHRVVHTNSRIKLDVTQIVCTMCRRNMDSFKHYLDHLSFEHGMLLHEEVIAQFQIFKLNDDVMQCLHCGESSKYFPILLKHYHKEHSPLRNHLCEICGKSFWQKKAVSSHMKHVHESQICKYCNEAFPSKYQLYNHVGSVHEPEKMKCPYCEKKFRNRYLRKRHLALEHNCESDQFVCGICDKTFAKKVILDRHKQKAHWECKECGEVLIVSALKKHMMMHDKEKAKISSNNSEDIAPKKKKTIVKIRSNKEDIAQDKEKTIVKIRSKKEDIAQDKEETIVKIRSNKEDIAQDKEKTIVKIRSNKEDIAQDKEKTIVKIRSNNSEDIAQDKEKTIVKTIVKIRSNNSEE